MGSCQKYSIILVRKWFKNWFYQKMSVTKIVLLNWYPSTKKELRKIGLIFDIDNWLWKSNFGIFWQLAISAKLKIQSFSLSMLILRQKSFSFCILHMRAPQPVSIFGMVGHCMFSTKMSLFSSNESYLIYLLNGYYWREYEALLLVIR